VKHWLDKIARTRLKSTDGCSAAETPVAKQLTNNKTRNSLCIFIKRPP